MEFWLGILVGFVGVFILTWAFVRPRRGDEPHCRRCRFSLAGLTEPRVCPECGRELAQKHATVRGKRPSPKRAVVWSAGLLFLAGTLVGLDWMNQTGFFPLSKYKPVFLLQAEAYLLGDLRASIATDELVDRFGNGALSQNAKDRLIRTAFARHAQTWRVFPSAQWDLIVAEVLGNRVSIERIEQLFEDCIVEIGIDRKAIDSQRPYPGEQIRITHGARFRVGSQIPTLTGFEFGRRIKTRFIDAEGEERSMTADWDPSAELSQMGLTLVTNTRGMNDHTIRVNAPYHAGTYTCIIDIEYDFMEQIIGQFLRNMSEDEIARLAALKKNASFTCTIEVVEKGTEDPPIVTAQELGLSPDQLIRIRLPESVESPGGMIYDIPEIVVFQGAIGTADRLDPTIGLGGELVFTQNERESRVPIVYHKPHELVEMRIALYEMFVPGTVSVRYEHDPKIARLNRNKMERVLGGSVELGTIEVVRPVPETPE